MAHEPIHVLLVEDNPGDVRLLREMLSASVSAVFALTHVERLVEAQQHLGGARADVILLDLSLPDSQGLSTFSQAHASAPNVPIVVLSGLDDEALAVEAVRQGAQDYLVKGQADGQLLARAVRYAIERARTQEALQQSALELQARNEELTAFAHTVAHDLKNPIGNVIGLAGILQDTRYTLPAEERREYLDAVQRLGHKMVNIIDELLLLSEVRQADVTIEPLDMTRILEESCLHLDDLISLYQAELSLPEAWPVAMGYPPWIEQVWINYLSNALKYGGHPPRLQLGATRQADGLIRFWLRDNGAGLSEEEQARLFNPFTRLDQARATGHGLGLSIVRRIVERLNGTVGVESEGVPGRGSTFFFSLPAQDRSGEESAHDSSLTIGAMAIPAGPATQPSLPGGRPT